MLLSALQHHCIGGAVLVAPVVLAQNASIKIAKVLAF
jgi:hypothetical protein